MFDCNMVNTPMEGNLKLLKFDSGEKEDPTLFKSLVGSLSLSLMESHTSSHMKETKIILLYLKGTLDFSLFYSSSNEVKLMQFCDSNLVGDVDDRKNTTSFEFFYGKHIDTMYHFIREYIAKKEVELVHVKR
ncbi:putative mitochondrial protein, partial [Mucuna pruriens]